MTREEQILSLLDLVKIHAAKLKRHLPEKIDFDDLMSAGQIGAIRAVDLYDRRDDVSLRTFADKFVRGHMLDYLRSLDFMTRYSRLMTKQVEKFKEDYLAFNNCEPSEEEIAAQLGMSIEKFRLLMAGIPTASPLEIDSFGKQFQLEDERARDFFDATFDIQELIDNAELSARERGAIEMQLDGCSQVEIAAHFNIAPCRVSQHRAGAIWKIRASLGLPVPKLSKDKKHLSVAVAAE